MITGAFFCPTFQRLFGWNNYGGDYFEARKFAHRKMTELL
jgi:hypothetical protein